MTAKASSGFYEATIDDGETDSNVITMEEGANSIFVICPALTGTHVTPQVSDAVGGTFVPFYDLHFETPADSTVLASKASEVKTGGCRYVQFVAQAAQSGSDAVIKLRKAS